MRTCWLNFIAYKSRIYLSCIFIIYSLTYISAWSNCFRLVTANMLCSPEVLCCIYSWFKLVIHIVKTLTHRTHLKDKGWLIKRIESPHITSSYLVSSVKTHQKDIWKLSVLWEVIYLVHCVSHTKEKTGKNQTSRSFSHLLLCCLSNDQKTNWE